MPDEPVQVESSTHTPYGFKNVKAPDFRTVYSNNASFGTTLFDITITFGDIVDVEMSAEGLLAVVNQSTRVVMSPVHAKIFALVFAKQVQEYEQKFGPIAIPQEPFTTKEAEAAAIATIAEAVAKTAAKPHKPPKREGT